MHCRDPGGRAGQRDVLARKSMELLFIRHALPQRVEGFEGPADPELSEAGQHQARHLAEYLAFERIHAVFASPLRRAMQTAEPVAERQSIEVTHRRRDRRVRPGGVRVHPDRAAQGRGPPRLAGRAHRRRPPHRRRRPARVPHRRGRGRRGDHRRPPGREGGGGVPRRASSTPTSPTSSASPIRAASSIPTTRRSTGSPRPAAASAACSRSTRRATCAAPGCRSGCSAVPERVADDGSRSVELGRIVQVAYAVEDVRAAARSFAERVGAGPFFVRHHDLPRHVEHRGEPGCFDHSSAYGQWGAVQVELVEVHRAEPASLAAHRRSGPAASTTSPRSSPRSTTSSGASPSSAGRR